jgi:galactose mutarotase-like enzyme
MNKKLSNQFFTAEINSYGAELSSFKRKADNCEYIWNGDPQFWTGHAPILFPIVCALNNGEARIAGTVYQMGNHGFAKKNEFALIEASDVNAVYRLSSNKDTLAMYPFKFNLDLIYTLNENQLKIEYQVENIDDKTIYFQLGTHPAFNCPLDNQAKFEDYYIEFESPENLTRFYMNKANTIIAAKSETLGLKNDRILSLTHERFYDGALVLKNVQSSKVTLKSDRSSKQVVLTYKNLPHMGIWQAKNAPFICIEPWHGLADTEGFGGDFQAKEAMVALKTGVRFSCGYQIAVF